LYENTDTGIPIERFIPWKVRAKIKRLLSLYEEGTFGVMHKVVQWWEETPISSFGFSFGGRRSGEYENMKEITSRMDEEPFDLL
jgi:hypothetical protein